MEALIALASAAGTEALKSWGVFAIVVMLLVYLWQRSDRGWTAERAKNDKLQESLAKLQDLRVLDAQQIIGVTKNGTATIAARATFDQEILNLLSRLVEEKAAPLLENHRHQRIR